MNISALRPAAPVEQRRVRASGRMPSLVPNYTILTLLLIFSLLPLALLVSNSFKTTEDVAFAPIGLPPSGLHFENYVNAWNQGHMNITLRNTLILTGGTIVGVLTVAGLAAYSLARLDLREGNLVAFYLIVISSMPGPLIIVPLFIVWRQLGLVDSLFGLMIIYCATSSPFATFLLRSFMISIPRELEEAARVDGATELQAFVRVILPICWPGFLTTGLIVSLGVWNEFLYSITFLHNPNSKTAISSLFGFATQYQRDWGTTGAAAIIISAPVVVIFLLLQRRFIAGLTQGSVKI